MSLTPKQIILSFMLFGLVSCGETPTSQLTEQFPILRSGPHDMEFAFIPSGTFRMGSPEDEKGRGYNETRHWVKLTEDYWMQTTEVTRGQWYEVMGRWPRNERCANFDEVLKDDDEPIVCVGWGEINDFIIRLNDQQKNSGYLYSLPTEAEWEYAARSYTETQYSIEGSVDLFAWYDTGHAHPTGKLRANLFGLYDVHGNVWEWVSDWYADYSKAESFSDAIVNPAGPNSGEYRVFRGGGWSNTAEGCRSANRHFWPSDHYFTGLGFRLKRTKI